MEDLTPLQRAHERSRELRAAGIEIERLDPLEKARRNPRSLAAAVRGKCFDCVGGHNADHGHVRAVRECPAITCPLHPVRPWQRRAGEAD